jgi:hypothetical protein
MTPCPLLRAPVWQAQALMSRDVLIRPRIRRASERDSSVAAEVGATIFLVARFQVAHRLTRPHRDGLGGLGRSYRGVRAGCGRDLLRCSGSCDDQDENKVTRMHWKMHILASCFAAPCSSNLAQIRLGPQLSRAGLSAWNDRRHSKQNQLFRTANRHVSGRCPDLSFDPTGVL